MPKYLSTILFTVLTAMNLVASYRINFCGSLYIPAATCLMAAAPVSSLQYSYDSILVINIAKILPNPSEAYFVIDPDTLSLTLNNFCLTCQLNRLFYLCYKKEEVIIQDLIICQIDNNRVLSAYP